MVPSKPKVLEVAPDAIVVTDARGRVMQFNPAAERLFGYVSAEIVGEDISRLFSTNDRTAPGTEWKDLLANPAQGDGPSHTLEIGARRSNDETFPAWLTVGVTKQQGRPRYVAIFRDTSEQKAAAKRQRTLEARLSALLRLALASEVAAGMAHDINQPLSAIATYAQAAKRLMRNSSPDIRLLEDVCEKIDEQARRAGDAVQGIRDRIRRPESQVTLLDINNVVADVMGVIEADADMEDISVTAEYTRPLPPVRGDAMQLQTVLLSLVRNSIEALRNCTAGDRRLQIKTSADESGRVRVSVSDRGPGVAAALGNRIFEPFVTAEGDRLGIGLSISQTIVRAHQGGLVYENNPDGGSTFVVSLPAGEAGAGR